MSCGSFSRLESLSCCFLDMKLSPPWCVCARGLLTCEGPAGVLRERLSPQSEAGESWPVHPAHPDYLSESESSEIAEL